MESNKQHAEFKYIFKPYFEKIIDEIDNLSKKLSSEVFNFEPIEERDLKYRDGAYGITEILQCPIKAQLRRKYEDEIEIKSNEITDGYIFEHLVKLVTVKLFGKENVTPEKVLPIDIQIDEDLTCKIDGHLDIFINLKEHDTIIGLELKSTVLQYNNNMFDKPDRIIFVEPNQIEEYNINEKYILQAQIQRYILEQLYPDKYIEHYLFIKTQLKTRMKLGKTYLVIPITKSIDRNHLYQICREFFYNITPRKHFECKYCIYKKNNLCEGINIQNENPIFKAKFREQYKYKLLEQYIELKKQLKQIEEELKFLFPKYEKYKDKYSIGWVEEKIPDLNILIPILQNKKLNLNSYFELKPNAIFKIKDIINNLPKSSIRKKKKFITPEINNEFLTDIEDSDGTELE